MFEFHSGLVLCPTICVLVKRHSLTLFNNPAHAKRRKPKTSPQKALGPAVRNQGDQPELVKRRGQSVGVVWGVLIGQKRGGEGKIPKSGFPQDIQVSGENDRSR